MAQFDDGKDQGALRTIGEVADALGIRQHVLRYWEQQFPMLQPLKRSGNRRYYRTADVLLVETIDRLVNREGYTIKGALQALSRSGSHKNMTEHDNPASTQADKDQAAPATGPAPFAPPAAQPLPLAGELPGELPGDGGLDAFFGRAPAAEQPPRDVHPIDDPAIAETATLADELKAIRDRLAQALAT